MKKIKFALLSFTLVFILISNGYSELLKNGSFEKNTGYKGEIKYWTLFGGDIYEIFGETYSGESAVKIWWSGGLHQTVNAREGYEYTLKAMLQSPKYEQLEENGTKSAVIEMEFLDKDSILITSERGDLFDKSYEPGKWHEIKTIAVTPPGCKHIRVLISFFGGEGGGIIIFDDVSLELTGKIKHSKEPYFQSLEGNWLFEKYDNLNWAKPEFDDSSWKKVHVNGKLESSYPEFTGFGWYRKKITIPEEVNGETLFLYIGNIDDADETYFNGKIIGRTGILPPSFQTAWNKRRIYSIAPETIHYGKENTIAIRIYDDLGDAGIVNRPAELHNFQSLSNRFNNGIALGQKISSDEKKTCKEAKKSHAPLRMKTKKLPNGGWTFINPEGKAFMPIGVEYEPLASYGFMNWPMIERDLNQIKDGGFNTIAIWCMDFHGANGAGKRMEVYEMVKLTRLAKERGLYIQFYLNIDRFINIFPKAKFPDGTEQGFDIDYCNKDYREFVKNFAKRLAMAFYPYNNVSTIAVWEEKIGLDVEFLENGEISVKVLFGSKQGKEDFAAFLKEKHRTIETLNKLWNTKYGSFKEAVEYTLSGYFLGVKENDHRQFDVLEFGQVMLIDFTKEFVDAYKEIDPSMLFQCRNYDLFGPGRAVDPRYSFLDTFGINQYSLGSEGYDITFREELVKIKLIDGIVGIAPYISNFGFRTHSGDGGTHGLVPNDDVKESMGTDTLSAFSYIPEVTGSSYFIYDYAGGSEGPFSLVTGPDAKPLPLFNSYKALHKLMNLKNEKIANIDYKKKPELYLFHGLDAIYDIVQKAWIEHTTLSWSLSEMNLNYKVLTDNSDISPKTNKAIYANFHSYDERLSIDIADKLMSYAKDGGTLIIGNIFGEYDRYLNVNLKQKMLLGQIRGSVKDGLKKGKVKLLASKHGITDMDTEITYFMLQDAKNLPGDAEVILEMEIKNKIYPAIIRSKFGKGTIYYMFFNPCQQDFWSGGLKDTNRASLPVMHILLNDIGIEHDKNFANSGYDVTNGRVNIHQKPIHHFRSKEAKSFGTYKDEYGLNSEVYSGGVITDDYLSFRGKTLNENGWDIISDKVTSIYAVTKNNNLYFFTIDPVFISLKKGNVNILRKTEKLEIYQVPYAK